MYYHSNDDTTTSSYYDSAVNDDNRISNLLSLRLREGVEPLTTSAGTTLTPATGDKEEPPDDWAERITANQGMASVSVSAVTAEDEGSLVPITPVDGHSTVPAQALLQNVELAVGEVEALLLKATYSDWFSERTTDSLIN
jgi:hypothetical protein